MPAVIVRVLYAGAAADPLVLDNIPFEAAFVNENDNACAEIDDVNNGERLPVLFTVVLGSSAATKCLNVGVAELPLLGPAKMIFAFCANSTGTNVPDVVIGDPVTDELNIVPSPVIATDVTVPLDDIVVGTQFVPLYTRA